MSRRSMLHVTRSASAGYMPPMLIAQLVKYALYALMVALVLRVAPLRRTFAELPVTHRRGLVLLFALMLIAQVIESKSKTYPFVKWAMYSDAGGEVSFYDYRGVRIDGTEEPIPVARLLRIHRPLCPTCSKRLVWRLDDFADERLQARTEAERAAAASLYERTLRAAWKVWAKRHPGVAYDEIRVWRAHFTVADYVNSSSIERELVWRVKLGEEGTPDAQ